MVGLGQEMESGLFNTQYVLSLIPYFTLRYARRCVQSQFLSSIFSADRTEPFLTDDRPSFLRFLARQTSGRILLRNASKPPPANG